MPKVSVVIPTYNTGNYLQAAIQSVLSQSYTDLELLVIDDGSTDQTPAILKSYQGVVRSIRQQNRGVAAARNRGILESRGEYIAFLDADDEWDSQKIELQLKALLKHPDCRACYTAAKVITQGESFSHIERRGPLAPQIDDLLLKGNLIGTPSSVIVERVLLQSINGFDLRLSQCADWELWIRISLETKFLYIDQPLISYRQHSNNMSRNVLLLEDDSFNTLNKGFSLPHLPKHLHKFRKRAFARNAMVLAGSFFHTKHYRGCLRNVIQAIYLDPQQLRYLLSFPLRRLSGIRRQFGLPGTNLHKN